MKTIKNLTFLSTVLFISGSSLLTLALFPSSALAKSLSCEIRINQKSVLNKKIETQKNQKTLIGQAEGITTYITEKDHDFFSNEGFVPQYELRFYGEGFLRTPKDQIISSIWGRDILIESICTPLGTGK